MEKKKLIKNSIESEKDISHENQPSSIIVAVLVSGINNLQTLNNKKVQVILLLFFFSLVDFVFFVFFCLSYNTTTYLDYSIVRIKIKSRKRAGDIFGRVRTREFDKGFLGYTNLF